MLLLQLLLALLPCSPRLVSGLNIPIRAGNLTAPLVLEYAGLSQKAPYEIPS